MSSSKQQQNEYVATAFVSCSLRKEDDFFVSLILNLLDHFQILPCGTVGKFDASPVSPIELMKRNIEQADIVVVIATKRYFTQDVHYDRVSSTISEMVFVEGGMAFANSKPVVVFVEKGTDIGGFFPYMTQYITLDGTQEDLDSQYNLIISLLNSACQKSMEIKRRESWQELKRFVIGGLAVFGSLQLLTNTEDEEPEN